VLVAGALAFAPTLLGGFLADDFVYIARFRALPWSEWPALFLREWSGGAWGTPLREVRPFAALSFLGDAKLFGGHALGYRLSNLALHLLATWVIVRLAWRYSGGRTLAALVAGGIFALHPAHVEAVAWITGRVDLIATTAALLFWAGAERFSEAGGKRRLALVLGVLFVGVFAKEFCSFVPLLLLLQWALVDAAAGRAAWRRRTVLLAGAIAVVAAFAICRSIAVPGDSIGYNVWTDAPAWQRQASYVGWLLPLLPFTDYPEWKTFSSLTTQHALFIAFTLAVLLGSIIAWRRHAKLALGALFFGGVWYLLTVTPLTGVVYHSPRHLYFPTVGLALAAGLTCGVARGGRLVGAVCVVWCATAHVATLRPWMTAGRASREALATLDKALADAGPDALAIHSAPARLGHAWLWAWSSPQSVSAPFLRHPPTKVLEHPVNFSQALPWFETRQPLETIRAARSIIVLFIDDRGQIAIRRISAGDHAALAESFSALTDRGLNPDSWHEWVREIATR
jgi:hypothetical protein